MAWDFNKPPISPGEILLHEFLLPMGVSQTAFARRIQYSQPKLNEVIQGKRGVSAEMALRLAAELNTSPQFWLNAQSEVDLWKAQQTRQQKVHPITVEFPNKTFISLYEEGFVLAADLQQFIDEWNLRPKHFKAKCSLAEYLGLTQEELDAVQGGNHILAAILEARRDQKNVADVLSMDRKPIAARAKDGEAIKKLREYRKNKLRIARDDD